MSGGGKGGGFAMCGGGSLARPPPSARPAQCNEIPVRLFARLANGDTLLLLEFGCKMRLRPNLSEPSEGHENGKSSV